MVRRVNSYLGWIYCLHAVNRLLSSVESCMTAAKGGGGVRQMQFKFIYSHPRRYARSIYYGSMGSEIAWTCTNEGVSFDVGKYDKARQI